MSTATLFTSPAAAPRVSFELFPPRTEAGSDKLWGTVTDLAGLAPDFFSVTYGAAGRTHAPSVGLVRRIIADTDVTPIAHLTCVGSSADQLREIIHGLLADGVRDFLALRGDAPEGEDWQAHPEGLETAAELVALLREVEAEAGVGPISVAVAAYPGGAYDSSGHPVTCPADLLALARKQAAGADFAITQLFYTAHHYTTLVESARNVGVSIPIVPGFIPLTDLARLERMTGLTGVPVPADLRARLTATDSPEAQYAEGLAASAELLQQILAAGAPGVHMYTFNTAGPTLDVLAAAGLRPAVCPA